jgi:hypothetical protein
MGARVQYGTVRLCKKTIEKLYTELCAVVEAKVVVTHRALRGKLSSN